MIKIIGLKNIDYVSKKTGRDVTGANVYYVDDTPLENLQGVSCYDAYINVPTLKNLLEQLDVKNLVGCEFNNFSYNRFGNIQGVIL